MALLRCFGHSSPSVKAHRSSSQPFLLATIDQRPAFHLGDSNVQRYGLRFMKLVEVMDKHWSFVRGSRLVIPPKIDEIICTGLQTERLGKADVREHPTDVFIGVATSQIASSAFTLGTAAVLPFYTLMVVAPKAEVTKRSMESSIPYIVLGILYAYLLYLSWTPETIRLMFASKYWLPELQGIAKMFSSEMTLASAWIHLLAVDLFAARQVYHDGLSNEIETRHSVSLCLLFCPIGILIHVLTKALSGRTGALKNH